MKILVVDTATDHLMVSLADGTELRAERVEPGGKGSSLRLTRIVEDLCNESGIHLHSVDLLAVAVGPGAFTGIRVGVGFVQGVAYALDRPVVPLSTLRCLAAYAPPLPIPLLSLIDARKGELYAGLFSPFFPFEPLMEEVVLSPERLVETVTPPFAAIGSGAISSKELLRAAFGPSCPILDPLPTPSSVPLLPLIVDSHPTTSLSAADLSPRYLRRPEAECSPPFRERILH